MWYGNSYKDESIDWRHFERLMIPVLIKEGHVKDEEGYKDLANAFEVAEILCPEEEENK